MKEIFDWVPWFEELASRIAEDGRTSSSGRESEGSGLAE